MVPLYRNTPSMALHHTKVDNDGKHVKIFNNPSPWCKETCKHFTMVASLARSMLPIPAMLALLKRLFSKIGQTVAEATTWRYYVFSCVPYGRLSTLGPRGMRMLSEEHL